MNELLYFDCESTDNVIIDEHNKKLYENLKNIHGTPFNILTQTRITENSDCFETAVRNIILSFSSHIEDNDDSVYTDTLIEFLNETDDFDKDLMDKRHKWIIFLTNNILNVINNLENKEKYYKIIYGDYYNSELYFNDIKSSTYNLVLRVAVIAKSTKN